MRIIEGGLTFGEFDAKNLFHIEKTNIYKNKFSGDGVKSVEFILNRPEENELLFVEARTTLPSKCNIAHYNKEIADISKKFLDSLQLAIGIWFGSHNPSVDAPQNKESFFTYGKQIILVLVIKNRTGKLTAISERIKQEIHREHKLMGLKVRVWNEELAIKANLIAQENGEQHND
ncbi:MAG: hypothetical protein FWC20_07815 [Oscillospiraceae bacterium]|nr:hypothetical protein [Oscillospiraceae bacterium]MCL2279296.1 hypothetical protein [Oscillospiraceae bacterium]